MSGGERTEAATPRRRDEARKRGQVAKSTELSSVSVLLALMTTLGWAGSMAGHAVTLYFQSVFGHLDNVRLDEHALLQQAVASLMTLARAVGPMMLVAMVTGVAVNVAQTGPMWSPEAMKPDFNRLNPLTGIQRFVSPRGLVELVKSLYKIGLISYIAYVTLRDNYPLLLATAGMELGQGVSVVVQLSLRLGFRVGVAMLILAALDYAFQRYQMEQQMKMTKEEVKQEHKSQEGSPQLKSRIRAKQRQMSRQRMMAEVPAADVVIMNPTHFAVALKYDANRAAAPIVVAKGQDLLALRIRDLARKSDVPVVENPPLARVLYAKVDVGREIPGDLYESVAEVLAFVYQINQRRRERAGL